MSEPEPPPFHGKEVRTGLEGSIESRPTNRLTPSTATVRFQSSSLSTLAVRNIATGPR